MLNKMPTMAATPRKMRQVFRLPYTQSAAFLTPSAVFLAADWARFAAAAACCRLDAAYRRWMTFFCAVVEAVRSARTVARCFWSFRCAVWSNTSAVSSPL